MASTSKLWDPLVRLFHWSLAFAFFANYFFTEEGEDWHQWIGYYACAWLGIRFVWGFISRGAASWRSIWPTTDRLRSHLRQLARGDAGHYPGHSPLGSLVMITMMVLMLALGVSGFMMQEIDYFWGEEWLEETHEVIANVLMALVSLHILAAIFESYRLGENLPLSMITGNRKKL